jgi:hypothetical protein
VFLSNGINPFVKRYRLPSLGCCFRNKTFHAFNDLVRIIFRLNNDSSVFFVDFDFCTGRDTKAFSHRFRQYDSPF